MRQRARSLRRIYAILRASGFSVSDRHLIAAIALGRRSCEVESLGDLADVELAEVASFLSRWREATALYMLGGPFQDTVRRASRAIIADKEGIMVKKDKGGESVRIGDMDASVEDKLAAFGEMVNTENRKQLEKDPNSELRNPIMRFGLLPDDAVVRSGISVLDLELGIGGLLRGTFNVIYGPSGSMKTGLCLNFVRWAQEHDMPVFYFDSENAVTAAMLRANGIDRRRMLTSGTSKLDVLHGFLRHINDNFNDALIIIDSLPAYQAPANYEKDNVGDTARLGSEASMWNEILSREIDHLAVNRNTIIAVNQLRKNFDRNNPYAPTHKPWGTERIEYAASTYIECRKPGWGERVKDPLTGSEMVRTKEMRLTLKKNKSGVPDVKVAFEVEIGKAVNREGVLAGLLAKVPEPSTSMPFIPAFRWDSKEDRLRSSTSAFCLVMLDDESLAAIRDDDPGFDPGEDGRHWTWAKKNHPGQDSFEDWLRAHPSYMAYATDRALRHIIDERNRALFGDDDG